MFSVLDGFQPEAPVGICRAFESADVGQLRGTHQTQASLLFRLIARQTVDLLLLLGYRSMSPRSI